jgi:hypothetical protein
MTIVTLALVVGSGQAPAQPKVFLSIFQVNQQVHLLKNAGEDWQITVIDKPIPRGPKPTLSVVTEVGTDYIIVRDPEQNILRIPLYAIAVVTSREKDE